MTSLVNHRYRILRVLASGGFSQTFLVEDTQMPSRRQCVLKQLKPPSSDPQIQGLIQVRFQREAAILEMLGERTSGIPKLYAYFVEQDQYYLVQELIEGQTLKDWIQSAGRQSEATVEALLLHILPVLIQVHEAGIIHRDIKPENIILRRRDRQPVLIDFGAVKEVVGTVANPQGEAASSIVIGTPGFMAPEQATGHPLPESDVYSLGLTAIYLLTGKLPQELPLDPSTGGYRWQAEAPNLSSRLAAVLSQAIQYAPRDRFASADAFLRALQSTGPIPIAQTEVVTISPGTGSLPTVTVPPSTSPQTQPEATVLQQRSRSTPVALWVIGGAVVLGGLGLVALQVGSWVEEWLTAVDSPTLPQPEPDPTIAAADAWFGAIAYSPSSRMYGYSYAYDNSNDAQVRALQECRDGASEDCQVLIGFENRCGALAVSSAGAYGSGSGPTAAVADAAAIQVCQQFGGEDCLVILRICPPNEVFQTSR